MNDAPDKVPPQHQPQRHIEIFTDVTLAPDLDLPVRGVDKSRVLDGAPPEEGIVAHERRDFAVRAGYERIQVSRAKTSVRTC